MAVKTTLKRLFKGTFVELAYRRLRSTLGVEAPHEAMARAEDEAMKRIMGQVLQKADTTVDVGCHMGEMLAEMVRLTPQGVHHAFEPIPGQAAWLEKKFPGVRVHRLAASDAAGETTFFHNLDQPAYSGLKQQEVGGRVERIAVKTVPLDDVLASERAIRLVKIDVEGAELRVLKGAAGVIRKHRPVVLFEYVKHASERFGDSDEAIYDYFDAEQGYDLYRVQGFFGGEGALSVQAFKDCAKEFRSFNYVALPRKP